MRISELTLEKLLAELNRVGVVENKELALEVLVSTGQLKFGKAIYEVVFGDAGEGAGSLRLVKQEAAPARINYLGMIGAGAKERSLVNGAADESRKQVQREALKRAGKKYEAMII
jgi:hypothetical protein